MADLVWYRTGPFGCARDQVEIVATIRIQAFMIEGPTHRPILVEAQDIIHGPRRDAYGPAKRSFERIAAMWSAVLETPITAAQVGQCMIALKLVREANAHSRDNLVDIAGYAALLDDLS